MYGRVVQEVVDTQSEITLRVGEGLDPPVRPFGAILIRHIISQKRQIIIFSVNNRLKTNQHLFSIGWVNTLPCILLLHRGETVLEIFDDVVDVLGAYRQADGVGAYALIQQLGL